jgi:YVTN family beta-propeller protein
VSAMYTGKISVLDLNTNQIVHTIQTTDKNIEGMLQTGGKVYVCPRNTHANYIYAIDTATNTIVDTIPINAYNPNEMILDKNNMIWVLSGDKLTNRTAHFTVINATNHSIIKDFDFTLNEDIVKPAMNPTKDTLYFIGIDFGNDVQKNGVYRMPITATAAPIQAFIPCLAKQSFYALGIDPKTGYIYVGDPKGFIQKGSIMQYSPQGILSNMYACGIGPSYFHFEP